MSRQAQSLTELALLFTMVVAFIFTMRFYIQRSLQAKYKAGADFMISQIRNEAETRGINSFNNMKSQYDPYYRESNVLDYTRGNSTVGYPESLMNQTAGRAGWERANPAQDAD
jgi:hypothetical protein